MPKAIVTGSGGLIGSESAARLVEAGYDVVGIENDTRAVLFGPEASTSHVTERLDRELPAVPQRRPRHSRRRRRRSRLCRARRGRSSWSSTPRRSPRTTGRRATRRPTSRSTPTAPSTCSRRPASTAPRRPSSSPRPTRSTATRRTGCRWIDARDAAGAARGPPLVRRHRHDDVDRLDPALAVRCLEGGRRPPGPGVRALLRHADGLLPRRLPDRAQPRRRPAARLPRLPDEVHRHRRARTPSSATTASRCATTCTAPTWSTPSCSSTRSPQAGRGLQHRRRARATPARCWRRSSSASGSPAAS